MRRAIRIAYIVMLCSIVRHLLSNEYGPFDRVVELGVFGLILYEIAAVTCNKLKLKRRVRVMLLLMRNGQTIEKAVLRSANVYTSDASASWKESVDSWISSVDTFLSKYSPEASAVFNHHVGSTGMIYGGISEPVRDYYDLLLARMNNLRSIMERPDVYF